MWRSTRSTEVAALVAAVLAAGSARGDGAAHEHHGHAPAAAVAPADSPSYARSRVRVELPEVTLIDAEGRPVELAAALAGDGPVLVQFVFTTCPAVCPVLAATFAAAQERLGVARGEARMVSISIDPEEDTPPRLRAFAERFGAGRGWLFLTGELAAVETVQKAFGAFRDNKMSHPPLTFVRAAPGAAWVRLDGFLSAAQLAAEVEAAPRGGE